MRNIILFATALLAFSCSKPESYIRISVENPSGFDRLIELIEIPVDSLAGKIRLHEGQVYIIKDAGGNVIPSQTTYDHKIVFQPGLKANDSKSFTIAAGKPQTFTPKTYGRFIPERKDDFAWENDRVAFRVYGPALIATDGPSNGIDCWYKRTNDLIIDKWYRDDLAGTASYHTDNGEGLDDYKVGRTLGAGAMAPYADGKLWLNENFASQELLENGPLRTTFRLTYKDLDIDGMLVGESRVISIDAGSQLSKVIQIYESDLEEPVHVAAGIVKRGGVGDEVICDRDFLIYAEPPSEKVGSVYIAVVMPSGIENCETDANGHALAITTCQPNYPVTYYTGYGWSKFGFPTLSDFQNYVERFAVGLREPLIVKYQ